MAHTHSVLESTISVGSADSLVQQYCLSCFCLLAFVKKAQFKSIHLWLWLSLHSSCKWH